MICPSGSQKLCTRASKKPPSRPSGLHRPLRLFGHFRSSSTCSPAWATCLQQRRRAYWTLWRTPFAWGAFVHKPFLKGFLFELTAMCSSVFPFLIGRLKTCIDLWAKAPHPILPKVRAVRSNTQRPGVLPGSMNSADQKEGRTPKVSRIPP